MIYQHFEYTKKEQEMKKFLTLILGILFFLSLDNAKSQMPCPSWATQWQVYQFTVGNCDYLATICWDCPANAGVSWIAVSSVRKVDQHCNNIYNFQQVKQRIYDQINTYEWLSGLCASGIPPCNNQFRYGIRDYNCWYKYNNGGIIEYYVCDYTTWCEQEWQICWDHLHGPIKQPVSNWTQKGGTPNCSGIEPGNPPDGQSSACWPASTCP